MNEEWREIPGWEGFYAVSDQGRVRSLARVIRGRPNALMRKKERLMVGSVNRGGYRYVLLSRGGTHKSLMIHILVLTAFVGPRPGGHLEYDACHNDGDKTNNALENLRWDTRSANQFDAVRHGRHHLARRTHCNYGHPYDEANTYRPPNGGRACRKCAAIRAANRSRELRVLGVAS